MSWPVTSYDAAVKHFLSHKDAETAEEQAKYPVFPDTYLELLPNLANVKRYRPAAAAAAAAAPAASAFISQEAVVAAAAGLLGACEVMVAFAAATGTAIPT